LGQPVFAPKSHDAIELAKIARNDGQPSAAGVASDQHIVAADSLATSFETCAYVGGVISGVRIERQYLQSRSELFNFAPVVGWPCGFRRTVQQFRQHDGRNAKAISIVIEAFTQSRRAIPQDTDAEIRVQQVSEH
jgi:hypothetical protein